MNETPPLNTRRFSPVVILLGMSFLFFIIFVAVSLLLFWSGSVRHWGEKRGAMFEKQSLIGIVEVKGVILDSKKTLKHLKDFEDNKDVKGVIVRLNSPGGAVGPSQEIYDAVRTYKK